MWLSMLRSTSDETHTHTPVTQRRRFIGRVGMVQRPSYWQRFASPARLSPWLPTQIVSLLHHHPLPVTASTYCYSFFTSFFCPSPFVSRRSLDRWYLSAYTSRSIYIQTHTHAYTHKREILVAFDVCLSNRLRWAIVIYDPSIVGSAVRPPAPVS